MAKKPTNKPTKKAPQFRRALDEGALAASLHSLSQDDVFALWSDIGSHLDWSLGDPTAETLGEIERKYPVLSQFIAFDTVIKRLDKLDDFDRTEFGVDLALFFPELVSVHRAFSRMISAIPNSVSKAQSWIRVIAADAGADADLEAAVYIASRAEAPLIDTDEILTRWHTAICRNIEQGWTVGPIPDSAIKRAKARTISLAEAAQVLTYGDSLPRFFSFRDEEEEHIDQTMFRAVEWLGITGFNPWLKSQIAGLSTGPQDGVDHARVAWWLFHWCRSDLALRMANRMGLESWLWGVLNGPHERSEPWRISWSSREGPRFREYLPLAGIIPFLWHRIQPSNITYEIPKASIALLEQTQLRCGAWPLFSDDSEPCLMATYAAVHGLGLAKPTGWERATKRAADWLITQQGPMGCWDVQGGPTVAITVQVLDAIAIGQGDAHLTFSLSSSKTETRPNDITADTAKPPQPIEIFYSYFHKDEGLRNELEKHLSVLKRNGVIAGWHDRKIVPGAEWSSEIDKHLETSNIILLLVSPDFIASDYCYEIEMKRAMDRHARRKASVIPIILRKCDWRDAPFGKLQALPEDGKPIKTWNDIDEAFSDVVAGIKRTIAEINGGPLAGPSSSNPTTMDPASLGRATYPGIENSAGIERPQENLKTPAGVQQANTPGKANKSADDTTVKVAETTSRRTLIGIIITAVMAAVATIFAAGINKCANPPQPGPSSQTFIGRIIDKNTEERIRGAKVSLEGESVPSVAYSDSEGVFSFPVNDPNKEIHLRIEANKYENFDLRITPAKNQVIQDVRLTTKTDKTAELSGITRQTSNPAPHRSPLPTPITNKPESNLLVIRGLVMDETGTTLPGARVTIAGHGSATTDASGNFQIAIAAVRGRMIYLNVAKEGYITKTLEEQASDDAIQILLRR